MSVTSGQPGADDRYHRQILLRRIGAKGQQRLANGHALVVGCGALGTLISEMLVRAGVGLVTIVDRDLVEWTNLQRQVLFDEDDARHGLPKAEAARRKLERINSAVTVRALIRNLDHTNAESIAGLGRSTENPPVDVVLDGTDNFETRFLINDLCVKHGVAYIYGGAVATEGMMMPVLPRPASGQAPPWGEAGATPCLACLFDGPPGAGQSATCDTVGVLGPLVTLIASMQSIEAIKVLIGAFDSVGRRLVSLDCWTNQIRQLDVSEAGADGSCSCCGHRTFPYLLGEASSSATSLCGRHAVQITAPSGRAGETASLDLPALADRLRAHGEVMLTSFMVRCRLRERSAPEDIGLELTVFSDGRTIVRGTEDQTLARALHARYVGA